MWRIRSSRSGCSIGSPPLNAPPDVLAHLQRAVEDRSDGDEPEEMMSGDGGKAGRRDAPAVAAVGGAAELARRDARLEIGRDAPGCPRKHALVGRLRRRGVHLD